LKGTTLQIMEHMNGTRQIAIQPKGDGSTIPESVFIDDYLIDIDEGLHLMYLPKTRPILLWAKKFERSHLVKPVLLLHVM
jgi:hypothetical protein